MIDRIVIGDEVLDRDGAACLVTNKTDSSIEVWIGKKTARGISSTNWFTFKDFEARFKKVSHRDLTCQCGWTGSDSDLSEIFEQRDMGAEDLQLTFCCPKCLEYKFLSDKTEIVKEDVDI